MNTLDTKYWIHQSISFFHELCASLSGTWTFRTLDYSYPGLFVPSMDFSYPGLSVPSLDDSYRDARLTKINVSYQNVPVFSVSQTP